MRSLVIFEVSNHEDTDAIQEWAEYMLGTPMAFAELEITDFAVRIDIPECFRLDK